MHICMCECTYREMCVCVYTYFSFLVVYSASYSIMVGGRSFPLDEVDSVLAKMLKDTSGGASLSRGPCLGQASSVSNGEATHRALRAQRCGVWHPLSLGTADGRTFAPRAPTVRPSWITGLIKSAIRLWLPVSRVRAPPAKDPVLPVLACPCVARKLKRLPCSPGDSEWEPNPFKSLSSGLFAAASHQHVGRTPGLGPAGRKPCSDPGSSGEGTQRRLCLSPH